MSGITYRGTGRIGSIKLDRRRALDARTTATIGAVDAQPRRRSLVAEALAGETA